jgi:hypothetical protein
MQEHRAMLTLHEREVSGYTIRVLDTRASVVSGELVKPSRRSIPFTITAEEHQFEVTTVLNDIFREFTEAIRDAEQGPHGSHSLRLEY